MIKNKTLFTIFGFVAVCFLTAIAFVAYGLIKSGFWRGPDAVFGDQNLKTSVALIELHKVRFGHYPQHLSDLRFLGQWDPIHVQSVSYYPSGDLTK